MLKFVIGIDRRTGRLGGDIERFLHTTYHNDEYEVVGLTGSLPMTSINSLAKQTDCLLEALYDFPANFYVALSTGVVTLPSPVGPMPHPVTVMTAIDTNGVVHFDCIEPIGYYVPIEQRNYTDFKPADLLDFIGITVAEVLATPLEPALTR